MDQVAVHDMRFRVPDAMWCAVPLRRAGTHPHRDDLIYTCFKPAAHAAGAAGARASNS
jgi:hypothetical protein